MTSGIPAQHHRPSLAEQPLYASSGERYAEVFIRPRAEMGLVELFVLRWRDVPDADGLSQPIREALTVDHGWQEVAPGSEAHRYDAIVAGRAGVTVDIDLLAGVIERARAQIDQAVVDGAVARYHGELDRRVLEGGEIVVGPEAGVVHYHPAGDEVSGVVRPVGLVWSGIRVDELERVGYEVLQPGDDTPCPPLAAGEIFGVPEHGVIYVWSRADFNRLAELSRRMHDASRRPLGTALMLDDAELAAVRLAEAGADSLEVAKALPRGLWS